MAALHIHNAIWTPEHAENSSSATPSQHLRRQSSLSTGTLRTTASDYSHPTEPLLLASTSESIAYKDLLSRQPAHPNGPQAGWDVGLTFAGDPTTLHERKNYQEQFMRKRLRRLRLSKTILEFVMGAWALYNVVRYFMAYGLYSSSTGQTASLALGTITTFSIAFLISAALFSMFRQYLLLLRVSLRYLLLVRSMLEWLFSCCLIVPALVSLGLVFAWKHSPDTELQLGARCYLDIDVVWSFSNTQCRQMPSWGGFLALSSIRVLLTLLHLMFYHLVSRAYHKIRRPSWKWNARPTPHRPSFRPPAFSHVRSHPSSFQPLAGSNSSIHSATTQLPQPPRTITPVRQTGDHTSLRSSRSRNSIPYSRSGGSRTVATNSPNSSEKELPIPEHDKYANFDPSMPQGFDNDVPQPNTDGELNGFVDSFRLILNQITRQTEEGLAFSQPDSYLSSSSIASASAAQYPGGPLDTQFNQYGSHHSQSESHVRILGNYIRRMPTIESLGSHEMSSIAHSSLHRDGGLQSPSIAHSMSRPSRRSTLSSLHSSRTNSITTNLSHHLMNGGGGALQGNIVASEMSGFIGGPRSIGEDEDESVGSGHSVSFRGPESSSALPSTSNIPFLAVS